MSVKLNRPPKPEESQKNSSFNEKTIPYPGFEPGTSELAVGSHNHCTIVVRTQSVARDAYLALEREVGLKINEQKTIYIYI
jgi:hypothetical protein